MQKLLSLLAEDRPLVMGIVNVTPDSFSDGGKFLATDAAVEHALKLIAEGADIVDIGGESTRPGADRVTVEQEIERVIPVIEGIARSSPVCISVDTSTPAVMIEAARTGASLINDVRALRREGALEAAAETGLPVCLMHMQGEPDTMQQNPTYADLLGDINGFLAERISQCRQHGIEQLLLDPGFGFGKTPVHNLRLVSQLSAFQQHNLPLLVGLSRKSTIAKITGDRLTGSVVGALIAVQNGARVVRVHDVAPTVAALKVNTAFAREDLDEKE